MILKISIDRITIPRGRRPADPDTVRELAKSINEIGLKTPISIRKVRRTVDGDMVNVWELVAGRHRLAAVKKNGDTRIECIAEEGTEDEATMWEIAENLHRKELTTQQKADDIARWVALLESKTANSTAPAVELQQRKRGPREGATSKVAKALGVSKDTVNESVKISKITPAAREAADAAGLTGHKDRLAIAREPSARQVAKVAELARGETVEVNPIAGAWDRATRKQRAQFVRDYADEFPKYHC